MKWRRDMPGGVIRLSESMGQSLQTLRAAWVGTRLAAARVRRLFDQDELVRIEQGPEQVFHHLGRIGIRAEKLARVIQLVRRRQAAQCREVQMVDNERVGRSVLEESLI